MEISWPKPNKKAVEGWGTTPLNAGVVPACFNAFLVRFFTLRLGKGLTG